MVEGPESTRGTLENTDENRMLFVRSPHHKHFGKAEHSYISYSLLVNSSHTNESWEGRNTCLWIYIYILYIYIYINVTQNKRWNWSSCTKLALSASWTHGLIAKSVRPSERNSVAVGRYNYFKESVSDEYYIYIYI